MSSAIPPGESTFLWNERDVLIVRKQSAVERYGSTSPKHRESHEQLLDVTRKVEELLQSKGLTSASITLTDLHASAFPYFKPQMLAQALSPKASLVIAVGGDGTLLSVSHYLGNQIQLAGINAAPKASVGHLCLARGHDFQKPLTSILNGQSTASSISRIEVKTLEPVTQILDDSLPLALNDVLFCNLHPAATSRYEVSVFELESDMPMPLSANNQLIGKRVLIEDHVSSGVWVATAAGSSAAISSYGLQRLPLASRRYLVAVREPYFRPGTLCSLTRSSLDGSRQTIQFRSRMDKAIVAVDGPDFCVQIDRDQAINLTMRPDNQLKIFV